MSNNPLESEDDAAGFAELLAEINPLSRIEQHDIEQRLYDAYESELKEMEGYYPSSSLTELRKMLALRKRYLRALEVPELGCGIRVGSEREEVFEPGSAPP